MGTTGLQKEEKNLLIGQFTGLAILSLLVLGWTIYIFVGVMHLNLAMMKKMFTSNPETMVYAFVPLIFILIGVLPRASKLLKDISSNSAEEGIAEVIEVRRSWLSRDWFVTLNAPGKEKIRMLRKDIYKLTPGKKIKFRIVPSSKILIGFEIQSAR